MEINNKLCHVCRTENDADFSFCKNCGAKLPDFANNTTESQSGGDGKKYPQDYVKGTYYETPEGNTSQTPPGGNGYYSAPYADYTAIEPELCQVETKKVQEYVGHKKRDYFMQAFITMKRTGRKTFFNWPIVLLGCLMSTPFAAAWFFYRKMYKIGVIICIAAVVLSAAGMAVTYSETKTKADSLYSEIKDDKDVSLMETSKTTSTTSPLKDIVFYVTQIVTIGGVIMLSMYANSFYLKSATDRIKKLDSTGEILPPFIYSAKGGTSLFAAILIPVLFSLMLAVIAYIPYLSVIANGATANQLLYIMRSI